MQTLCISMVAQKCLYVLTSPTSTGEHEYTPRSIKGKLKQKSTVFGLIRSQKRVEWKLSIPFNVQALLGTQLETHM